LRTACIRAAIFNAAGPATPQLLPQVSAPAVGVCSCRGVAAAGCATSAGATSTTGTARHLSPIGIFDLMDLEFDRVQSIEGLCLAWPFACQLRLAAKQAPSPVASRFSSECGIMGSSDLL